MRTARDFRTQWLACALAACFLECGGQGHAAAPRVVEPANTADTSDTKSQSNGEHERKPFSGEIVFHLTAVSAEASGSTKDLGQLHYFISGAHWKHVDASGETAVLYDPESRLIHYFKPQLKTVDASHSDGPIKFETLPGIRVVLGRTCKGVRWTTNDRKVTAFYDPDLFVDPAPFAHHHYGHWAETLAVTHGALILWSDMQLPQGDIISEPISIQSREFDPSFWQVPNVPSSDVSSEP